jgi:TatD DNase family protein
VSLDWIDVHTHLNMLETSVEDSIKLAAAQGVTRMFTIGTQPADHPIVLEIAKKHYPTVCCTLGVHPHDAKDFSPQALGFMRREAVRKEVVAIGEIGLDFYYEHSDRAVQMEAFEQQLALAVEMGLPVEIHTRDAEPETVEILKKFNGKVKGLLHCFTGTQWLADEALKLGLNISISGVVTFKNADSLRSVVKSLPLDRIHVETDAPFLAPMPHRGKKNTPAFVVHTAQFVADLKGISLETLSLKTKENAIKLFHKLNWN